MVSYLARWLPTNRSPHARLLFYVFRAVSSRQSVLVCSAATVGTGARSSRGSVSIPTRYLVSDRFSSCEIGRAHV